MSPYKAAERAAGAAKPDATSASDYSGSDEVPVHVGRVEKQNVLAYITGYGENEMVVRPERVKIMHRAFGVRTVPTRSLPRR